MSGTALRCCSCCWGFTTDREPPRSRSWNLCSVRFTNNPGTVRSICCFCFGGLTLTDREPLLTSPLPWCLCFGRFAGTVSSDPLSCCGRLGFSFGNGMARCDVSLWDPRFMDDMLLGARPVSQCNMSTTMYARTSNSDKSTPPGRLVMLQSARLSGGVGLDGEFPKTWIQLHFAFRNST